MKRSMIQGFAAVLLSALVLGCGGGVSDENLSAKGDADPAKLKQAQAEVDAAAARSKAAEAARTKGRIKVEEK